MKLKFYIAFLYLFLSLQFSSCEFLNMVVKYKNEKLCHGIANYVDIDTYCLDCILMWENPDIVTLRGQNYTMAKNCCNAIGNTSLTDFV